MYIAKHIRFKEKRCAYSINNDIRILTIQRLVIKSKQRDSSRKLFIKYLKILPQKHCKLYLKEKTAHTKNFVCINRDNKLLQHIFLVKFQRKQTTKMWNYKNFSDFMIIFLLKGNSRIITHIFLSKQINDSEFMSHYWS